METERKSQGNQRSESLKFGEALARLMDEGSGHIGCHPWGVQELADETNVTDRTVRNWLANSRAPEKPVFSRLVDHLFLIPRDETRIAEFRMSWEKLREAHNKPVRQTGRNRSRTRAGVDPVDLGRTVSGLKSRTKQVREAMEALKQTFEKNKPNDWQFCQHVASTVRNLESALQAFEHAPSGASRLAAKGLQLYELEDEAAIHGYLHCFEGAPLHAILASVSELVEFPASSEDLLGLVIENDALDEPPHWARVQALLQELERIRSLLEKDLHELGPDEISALDDALGDLENEILRKRMRISVLVEVRYRLDAVRAAIDRLRRLTTAHELLLGSWAEQLPPRAVFRDSEIAPAMVIVPAGTFSMGATDTEPGMRKGEGPPHKVHIDYKFAIGRFPVIFEEYGGFSSSTGAPEPNDRTWGRHLMPVINVSWEDAHKYVDWLLRETGNAYRLPSESEWEYAARSGTQSHFWWGDEPSPEHANYDGNIGRTTRVDKYPANPWGLYDMLGNVFEWVEDCWNETYDGAPADGAPNLHGDCARHTMRGGSWDNAPWNIRAAYRRRDFADVRLSYVGFRVARSIGSVDHGNNREGPVAPPARG